MSNQLNTKTVAGVYALLLTDLGTILKCNTGAGAVTINCFSLATLSGNNDKLIIEDESGSAGTNSITINAFAGQTINGVASLVLNQNNASTVMEIVDNTKRNATISDLGDMVGVVAIANGGTGQITQTAAFDALDPLTTKGDVITHDGTNSVRQGVGADGTMLMADSTQTNGVRYAGGTFRASVTTGINAKTLATTSLYTVPTGKQFVTDYVVVYPTAVTGTGNGPRYSVGTNAATYDNILTTTFTTNMDTTVEYSRANVIGTAHTGAAAEVVTYNVTTISTATTMTVAVELRGHFI